MLSIEVFDSKGRFIKSYSWTVDAQLPFFNEGTNVISRFHSMVVRASGPELNFIRQRMSNLPDNGNKTHVSWYGDSAKFIAANL